MIHSFLYCERSKSETAAMNFNLTVRKHISKYLYCMYFIEHLEKEIDARCKKENRERLKQEESTYIELMQKAAQVSKIKIYGLSTSRIGEFAIRGIEIKKENILNESRNVLGIYIPYFQGWQATNLRFLYGFSREYLLVNELNLVAIRDLIKRFRKKLDISEFHKWKKTSNCIWNIKLDQSIIHMNENEINEAKQLISSQNIIDITKPYICFAARDQAYLSTQNLNVDISYHSYRNSKLQDMKQGVEYCNKQKIQCVLMGKKYAENNLLQGVEYIDYSRKYYNELLDWYFMKNCKFYFGDAGGIGLIPQVLGKPIAFANIMPNPVNIPREVWKEEDIVIFKKLWSESKGRYLTLIEMWDLMGTNADLACTDFYEKQRLRIIDNTETEIYELVKEMNERLDGVYSNETRAEELREKYLCLLKKWCAKNNYDYDCIYKVRIGTDFLEKNQYLFEEEEK